MRGETRGRALRTLDFIGYRGACPQKYNDWPDHPDYSGRWCHSDMKDVAYFYNFKFYDKAAEKGNLK